MIVRDSLTDLMTARSSHMSAPEAGPGIDEKNAIPILEDARALSDFLREHCDAMTLVSVILELTGLNEEGGDERE